MGTMDEVQAGWRDHGDDPEAVFARIGDLAPEDPAALFAVAALTAHVGGEHLGRWTDTLDRLGALTRTAAYDPASVEGRAVHRLEASLWHCLGDEARRDAAVARATADDGDARATLSRALAVAASALAGQGRTDEAIAAFEAAVDEAGVDPELPVARALAITGNNLACDLEERPDRTAAQTALMKRAAEAGRTYWAIAGTWVEVRIAEYRLAMTHLAAGEPETALVHVDRALAMVEEHGGSEGDRFFALLAQAQAHHALADHASAAASLAGAKAALMHTHDDVRAYCMGELARVAATIG